MFQRRSLAVICVLLLSGIARATPQIPDILIYKGTEYRIQNTLLETYFKKFPERKPEVEGVCSALWRGYVATFEVIDNSIVLKDVVADACWSPRPALQMVVPDCKRLVIDWYSGLLVSIYGRNDADPYGLEWLDRAEKYSLFEVDGGRLGRVKHFDNAGFHKFKNRNFSAYKKTAEYKQEIKKMTENGRISVADADANISSWLFWNLNKFLVE